jgi:hypothetical protein
MVLMASPEPYRKAKLARMNGGSFVPGLQGRFLYPARLLSEKTLWQGPLFLLLIACPEPYRKA